MKKMIYYIISIVALIFPATMGYKYMNNKNKDSKSLLEYKYLFRDDIYSSTKKDSPSKGNTYQLAPVMRGKTYSPYYIYMPQREQYLIRSSVEPKGFRRYDTYAPPHIVEVNRYVLIDKKGHNIRSLDTDLHYSIHSGIFFTPAYYMNWLDAGDTTKNTYASVLNKDLKMDRIQFADTFRHLHAQATYFEYVNLRTRFSGDIGSGVVFKINEKWHMLLNGVSHSNLYAANYKENAKTGIDEYTYRLSFDYYDPDNKKNMPYPQSPSLIESVYLETSDPRPFAFNRRANHDGLKLKSYYKQSSTGWHGIAEIRGIPIFVPGTGEGIAYMQLKVNGNTFKFKIPQVTKYDYRAIYNLGVRTFKIPAHSKVDDALVFVESTQNVSHFMRQGGGIYVVRPCTQEQQSTSSLPLGVSEERFAQLPLTLQVALLNRNTVTQLECNTWYPEIELLSELKYLRIDGGVDEIPDGISAFKNLEVLNLDGCGIKSLSPKIADLKHLKILDLYSNRLTSFPQVICELSELRELNIGGSDFHEIPDCIANLTKLHSLEMRLQDNVTLPETILTMKNLRIKRAEEMKDSLPESYHFLFEKE